MVLYSLICWEMSGLSPQTASILKNEKLVPTAALTGSMGGGQDLTLNHVVLGMALVAFGSHAWILGYLESHCQYSAMLWLL